MLLHQKNKSKYLQQMYTICVKWRVYYSKNVPRINAETEHSSWRKETLKMYWIQHLNSFAKLTLFQSRAFLLLQDYPPGQNECRKGKI